MSYVLQQPYLSITGTVVGHRQAGSRSGLQLPPRQAQPRTNVRQRLSGRGKKSVSSWSSRKWGGSSREDEGADQDFWNSFKHRPVPGKASHLPRLIVLFVALSWEGHFGCFVVYSGWFLCDKGGVGDSCFGFFSTLHDFVLTAVVTPA